MESIEYPGFKLKRLMVFDHPVLGTANFDFLGANDKYDAIYTSVLIGSNGTGKSTVFRIIISLLIELNDHKKEGKFTKSNLKSGFQLEYYAIGDHILYGYNKKDGDTLLINNRVAKYSEVSMPAALIANSIMITDKFPFPNEERTPFYKYLGIKRSPQAASTGSYTRKTVKFIVDSVSQEAFIENLRRVLTELLEIEHIPHITYYTQNSRIFKEDFTADQFIEYFEAIDKQYASTLGKIPPFKLNFYKSQYHGQKKKIEELVRFASRELSKRLYRYPKSPGRGLSYNLFQSHSLIRMADEYNKIEDLRNLGFLSPPHIELLDPHELANSLLEGGYGLEDSSSGEYHLISTLVGIMASIKPNSLIVIDEPEVSLHPNWQMRYLNFLRKIFSHPEYKTCHIIVATHSHFLVSDLDGTNASLLVIEKIGIQSNRSILSNKLKITPFTTEEIEEDNNTGTLGWSAEEVLYRVFGVKTTRNKYVEDDLRTLLHLISINSDDTIQMNEILQRISKIKFSKNDPITKIINKAKDYLSK